MGWQSIETAPRDGSEVVVSTGKQPWLFYAFTARYIDGRWHARFGVSEWKTFEPEPRHWFSVRNPTNK
jgi:hypothetical protein